MLALLPATAALAWAVPNGRYVFAKPIRVQVTVAGDVAEVDWGGASTSVVALDRPTRQVRLSGTLRQYADAAGAYVSDVRYNATSGELSVAFDGRVSFVLEGTRCQS